MKLTPVDRRIITPSAVMSRVRARLNHPPIGATDNEVMDLVGLCVERVGTILELARIVGVSERAVRNWRDGINRPIRRYLSIIAELMGEVA